MSSATTVRSVEGELRAARGALVFIPDGTQRLLRVTVPLDLGRDFRKSRARMVLTQPAKSVLETDRFEPEIQPTHGVPERIVGDVLDQDGDRLTVGATFPIVVTVPDPARTYSGRVLCEMTGALEGREAELVDTDQAD